MDGKNHGQTFLECNIQAISRSLGLSWSWYAYASKNGYGSFRGDPDVWNEWVTYKRFDPDLLKRYNCIITKVACLKATFFGYGSSVWIIPWRCMDMYGSWYGSGPFAKSSASEGVVAVAMGSPHFSSSVISNPSGNKMHVSNRDPFSKAVYVWLLPWAGWGWMSRPHEEIPSTWPQQAEGLLHKLPGFSARRLTACNNSKHNWPAQHHLQSRGKHRKLLRNPWGNSEQYWLRCASKSNAQHYFRQETAKNIPFSIQSMTSWKSATLHGAVQTLEDTLLVCCNLLQHVQKHVKTNWCGQDTQIHQMIHQIGGFPNVQGCSRYPSAARGGNWVKMAMIHHDS
jgi:hypothetical protein